jgi:cytochrome P450
MLCAADRLSDRWRRFAPEESVDVAGELTLLTLNVLALTIFSDGIGGDFEDFRSAMNAYFASIGRIDAFDLWRVPSFVPRPGRGRLLGRPRDHGQHARVVGVLLSQSAEWYAKVRDEADRELAGDRNGLTERLSVTRAVVEEALRLYPPIAALSRISEEGDTLEGVDVRPRSLIVIAPYVLHRHLSHWDRPDVFDPSRFLGEAKAKIARFAYLPFGAGPRTCIGSSFALQEATIVLATLVQRFDMQLLPDALVWPVQKITLRPARGLPMRIRSRQLN